MNSVYDRFRLPAVRLFCALFLISSGGVAWAAPGTGQAAPMVTVETIQEKDTTPVTDYVGHVEAIQTVDLKARVEGFLEKVNFREGDTVRKDQVLYVIEQASYMDRVNADKAALQQARAELTRAGQHLKRLREARPEAIPATDLDDAVAAELVAQAQVASAKAALAISELNLAYTTIKAPISGRIGRTAYTLGNLVGPSSGTMARIVQIDPIRVAYSVSENDIGAVSTAMSDAATGSHRVLAPEIRLAGGELFPKTGKITFVDNQVDTATGTITVMAEFSNPGGRLISGQYVTVLVRQKAPVIMPVVPQASVLINRDGRFVMVVDDAGVVSARSITIGQAVDGLWAVTSGLSAGERVIVQGIQKVRPGQTVTIAGAGSQEN